MAPEYALWGYLTFKADVYSFGVLVLEIVAGITNSNFMGAGDSVCLLEFVNIFLIPSFNLLLNF